MDKGRLLNEVINKEKWLLEAKRDYLLFGKEEFNFAVRRRGSNEGFYLALEQELQRWSQLRVTKYRTSREGFVKIARPSEVCFGLGPLIEFDSDIVEKRSQFVDLEARLAKYNAQEFMQTNFVLIESHLSVLVSVLNVFEYLMANKENLKGLRPREVSHGESSKLLGQNALLLALLRLGMGQSGLSWEGIYEKFGIIDQKQEIRFFAPVCYFSDVKLNRLHGIVHGSQTSQWKFIGLEGAIIIENYESFLSVAEKASRHLVIWGQGWKVISMLQFLETLEGPMYYWGDLDTEGLEIFLRLREELPDLKSLGMNLAMLDKYKLQIQRMAGEEGGSPLEFADIDQTTNNLGSSIIDSQSEGLEERQLYGILKRKCLRLEQEKIAWLSEGEFSFI